MSFVSAKYAQPGVLPDPPGMAKGVQATDEFGNVWSLREDSETGDWLRFIEGGGTIDPPDPPVIAPWQVDQERDRRITGGFEYMGHRFQSDDFSQRNMADASQAASVAIAEGRGVDGYRWKAGATEDFVWIDANNDLVPMTAYDVRGLYQNMINWKERCIFIGRELKYWNPIPLDYNDDSRWTFVPPPELPA